MLEGTSGHSQCGRNGDEDKGSQICCHWGGKERGEEREKGRGRGEDTRWPFGITRDSLPQFHNAVK